LITAAATQVTNRVGLAVIVAQARDPERGTLAYIEGPAGACRQWWAVSRHRLETELRKKFVGRSSAAATSRIAS
jgi:hypothetical protein